MSTIKRALASGLTIIKTLLYPEFFSISIGVKMIKIQKDKLLLKPEDFKPSSKKFEILGVLNPAAVRLKSGKILLYVRVIEKLKETEDGKFFYTPRFVGKNKFKVKIDRFHKKDVLSSDILAIEFKNGTKRLNFISHLRRVYLDKSGLNVLKIEQRPCFYGTPKDAELGVEDPRITKMHDKYYMTYVGLSREESISTYLAESKDCKNWKRLGIIFGQQDKDSVLFPEKIEGRYVVFDRPEGNFQLHIPNIWVAFSKDLSYWGKLNAVSLHLKDQNFSRVGAGPPPIKTDRGWLLIFSNESMSDSWTIGAALLDINNPSKLIARTPGYILQPVTGYEREGLVPNVTFPEGAVVVDEKLYVYYGSADTVIGLAICKLDDLLDYIETFKK